MNGLVSAVRAPAATLRAWVQRSDVLSSAPAYAAERAVDVVLRIALTIASAITIASVTLLAVVHVDDRFEVNQASGTWFAHAQDLRAGLLYRPLFDDGFYGLSGYMPLQFVFGAGASLFTGEYLVSAKLLAYASGVLLLVLVYALLRASGCPPLLAIALVSAILSTHAGLVAVTGIHGDTLPLVLELAAIALISRSTGPRAVVCAAMLCALALFAKFAAVWAPAAIVLWLLFKERRRAGLFVGALGGSAFLLLAIFEVASRGRLTENLAEFFVPGGSASEGSLTAGISTFFDLMASRAPAIWLLLPFAALALLQATCRRSFTLAQLSLAFAAVVVVVILGNPGSDFNHLLDVCVLTVLVVGGQWGAAVRDERARESVLPALVSIALILGIAQSYRLALKPEAAHAARVALGRTQNAYSTHVLDEVVRPGDSLLSEDPVLPILRGERPILLDGIGLRRLEERHPSLVAELERRLDDRSFDRVVLINSLANREWYERISMGPAVRDAIARNYRLVAQVPAPPHRYYWVYAPRSEEARGGGTS